MTPYLLLTVLVGAISVAGVAVSSTLIMDTSPAEEWDEAFGRFNQVGGWGLVGGRLVGLAWITYATLWLGNESAQRSLWLISGGLSILGALAAWRLVPSPRNAKPRPPRRHSPSLLGHTGYPLVERLRFLPHTIHYLPSLNPARLLSHGAGRGWTSLRQPLNAYYLASFALFSGSVLGYTPFAVWQRQALLEPTSGVFLMGMINSMAAAFAYRWVGTQMRQHGSMGIQIVAVSLRVLVFGGFATMAWMGIRGPVSLTLLLVLQIISGISWAGIAVAGNITVAHLAYKGSEGTCVGSYNSFVGLGSIVGALLGGYIAEWFGFAATFVMGATGIAVATLLMIGVRRAALRRGLRQM